jgi:hypothetical protein
LRAITIRLPVPADAVGGRIYVLIDERLVFLDERPNRGGFVSISVIGFRNGQIVAA